MATKNPRLTITFEPALAAQLRRLSELTGNSQSSLVAELLSGSGPVLEKIITVLEAAQSATASMKGMIAAEIDVAQAKMEKQLGLALEGYDEFARPILDLAEDVKRRANKVPPERRGKGAAVSARRAGAVAPAPSPKAPKRSRTVSTPFSNRGVRSVDNPVKERKGRVR